MPEPKSGSQHTSHMRGLMVPFAAGLVVMFAVCLVVWKTLIDTDTPESLTMDESVGSPKSGPLEVSTSTDGTGDTPNDQSPPALAGEASQQPNNLSQTDKTSDWDSRDPHEILDMYASIPESIRDRVVHRALYQIASEDPEAALERAPDVLDLSALHPIYPVVTALRSFAESDLDQAIDWVNRNVDDSAKNGYIVSTLMHSTRTDPDRAFQYALTMPSSSEESPEYGVVIGMLLVSKQVPHAKKLAPQIRDATWRSIALATLGGQLASSDPDDAMAYGLTIDVAAQPEYYESVIGRWAQSNLDQAERNISQVPTGTARDRALRALVTSRQALDQAETWVRRQYDQITDDAIRSATAAMLAQRYREADESELAEQYRQDVDPNLVDNTVRDLSAAPSYLKVIVHTND